MRIVFFALGLLSIVSAPACGGDGPGSQLPSKDGAVADQATAADAPHVADSGKPTADGPKPDVLSGADSVVAHDGPPVTFTDGGCVDWSTAAQVCGFKSDLSVCKLAVSCKLSSDVGQCKINCEMGTTVSCYTMKDVDCILKATSDGSCSALKACNWIL
jgi:hypothetical protein